MKIIPEMIVKIHDQTIRYLMVDFVEQELIESYSHECLIENKRREILEK